MSDGDHIWHLIYRTCVICGTDRDKPRQLCEPLPVSTNAERARALQEARALIREHAWMTWNAGQLERSDGITDLLSEFDSRFPEGKS